MRAHASWRSLVTMPSRAIAFSIATSASVATCAEQAVPEVPCQTCFSCLSTSPVSLFAPATTHPAPQPFTRHLSRTWCPSPRLPLWIMMQTWPTWSMPILRAATRSNTSSMTWGGRSRGGRVGREGGEDASWRMAGQAAACRWCTMHTCKQCKPARASSAHLNLGVVVARPQGAHLWQPPLLGTRRHLWREGNGVVG